MAGLSSVNRSTVLSLPRFVDQHSDVLIVRPLKIVLIIVVALVVRAILHRMINRLTRSTAEGTTPRILQPLKDRAVSARGSLFEGGASLSERRRQRAETIGSVLKSGVSFAIFVMAFLSVLEDLGINIAPFIAGTSILGVALGFGAQNIVRDFLAGMFMIMEDQYGVGDVVDVKEATGTVEAVGLRTIRLRDAHGTVWYMRNGEIIRVGNKSQQFATVLLDIPIDPHADLDAASEAMLSQARAVYDDPDWQPLFLGEPELVGVEELTREQAVIRLTARVRPLEQWKVAREMRHRIWARFDELGVTVADAETVRRRRARRGTQSTGDAVASDPS